MEVDKYILEKEIVDGVTQIHLMRIILHEGLGFRGEEYYNGKWHPYQGALTYMFDPYPGDFINQQEAEDAMKEIDQNSR